MKIASYVPGRVDLQLLMTEYAALGRPAAINVSELAGDKDWLKISSGTGFKGKKPRDHGYPFYAVVRLNGGGKHPVFGAQTISARAEGGALILGNPNLDVAVQKRLPRHHHPRKTLPPTPTKIGIEEAVTAINLYKREHASNVVLSIDDKGFLEILMSFGRR